MRQFLVAASVVLTTMTFAGLAPAQSASAQSPSANAATPPATPAVSSATFPLSWQGQWKGDVEVLGADFGKFSMELVIAPTSDANTFDWKIIYDGQAGRQERPYALIIKDAAKGLYEIDERNGIVLPQRMLGGVLRSQFEVMGSRIDATYELLGAGTADERIMCELVSYRSDQSVSTGGKDNVPEVKGWTPSTVQRVALRRKDAQPASALAQGERPAVAPAPAQTPAPAAAPSGRAALAQSPITWTTFQTERYPGKQDDIFFISPDIGWYVNGAGKIFKTTDAGKTWTMQLHKPGTYFRCIAFVDDKLGFAGNIGPGYFPNVSDDVPLYVTKNGGETWDAVTSIEGPKVVGLCALEVVRYKYINAGNLAEKTRLVAVGRVGGPAAMIVSDDLGATWQQLTVPDSAKMAFDVHFFDDKHGFIASATSDNVEESKALILATDDGGTTWREAFIGSRPFELTWKLSFPSRDIGYVTIQSYNPDPAASQRFIAKTTDGGKTWNQLPLIDDAKVRQFGIAFIDDQRGFVGAMPGGFATEDGGKTWTRAEFGNAVNKIRVLRAGDDAVLHAIGVNVATTRVPMKP